MKTATKQNSWAARLRAAGRKSWFRIYGEYLRSPEWKARRKEALARAEEACQICGSPRDLHVHHRTYERVGCERPSDLTVLCGDCHHHFHAGDEGDWDRDAIADARADLRCRFPGLGWKSVDLLARLRVRKVPPGVYRPAEIAARTGLNVHQAQSRLQFAGKVCPWVVQESKKRWRLLDEGEAERPLGSRTMTTKFSVVV